MHRTILMLVAVTILAMGVVSAENVTIMDGESEVDITSAYPEFVGNVTLHDNEAMGDNELDLTPGTTTPINCSGEIYDFDGWSDVANISAVIWSNQTTYGGAEDPVNHYTNESCNWTQLSATNVTFQCLFDVQFYADPVNWTCNVTVSDQEGLNTSATDDAVMLEMLALDLPTPLVDFGDMSLGQNKSDVNLTIENEGNVQMDADVDAWYLGGDSTSDVAMNCSYGNISLTNLKTSNVTGNYSDYFSLNVAGPDYFAYDDMNLDRALSGTTPTSTDLYFGLLVPDVYGLGGFCQGNISVQVRKST